MKFASHAVFTAALVATPLLIAATRGPSPSEATVIYGDDDRTDLYAVTSSRDLELAASTVVLIESARLARNGDRYDIRADTFGRSFGLCSTERFFEQPAAGFCSGALVAEDLLITAGHCVETQAECDSTKFVFDYAVNREGVFPTSAKAEDVVGCETIIARKKEANGSDYALIQLDRAVTNRRALQINRVSDLQVGAKIGVIGHPSGLPTKVAFGESHVRDTTSRGYFTANLDTYGGNSGSAVFNAVTGLIEGILVRGEMDFVTKNGCRISKTCAADGCRGEHVTKISELAILIPEPGNRRPAPPSSQWPKLPRRTRP